MTQPRTLILGAGFLGTRLHHTLPGSTLARVDIADRDAVGALLAAERPAVVINAAGKTGRPNVDWCEKNPEATWRSNVDGAVTVAEACADTGAWLLHFGSGCVFSGASPRPGGWREDDPATPISFYSRSKYAADQALVGLPNVAIVRLRMPIDHTPGERNLITKLARHRVVIDVENSVTLVEDLVGVVRGLVGLRATGVFHATNPGVMSHRTLLALYRELVDPTHAPTFIPEGELLARGLVEKPRSTCILASTRLEAVGLSMRPIDAALRETVRAYGVAFRAGGGRG